MRHTNPKYCINQLVPVEFITTGIIKGMRLEPIQRNSGFTTIGWEYSIWRQVENYPGGWQEWGWVKEADIDKLKQPDPAIDSTNQQPIIPNPLFMPYSEETVSAIWVREILGESY